MKKTHFSLYYILIGAGMLALAFINHELPHNKFLLIIFILFFIIGAMDHFKELIGMEKHKLSITNINKLVGIFSAAAVTWYINHEMGFGPVIANGLVGVIVALSLPGNLSGAYYAASFVGMSSQSIIPSVSTAGVGGLLTGIIILTSKEVYHGIGGKGGTTAAISTQIVSTLINLFL